MVIADHIPYTCFATDTLKKLSPPLNAAVYAMTIFAWLGVYYGQHWRQTNRPVRASAKEDNIEESLLLLLYCILVYNIHYTCVCVHLTEYCNVTGRRCEGTIFFCFTWAPNKKKISHSRRGPLPCWELKNHYVYSAQIIIIFAPIFLYYTQTCASAL